MPKTTGMPKTTQGDVIAVPLVNLVAPICLAKAIMSCSDTGSKRDIGDVPRLNQCPHSKELALKFNLI
jgi:hypothetical protein